ncbi:DUF2157 domain-containing protein [Brachyspira pilosicoli]|uniref:DUF2157 domain-containing protein n=1 Tax=Brachyspira pilosicoli TaxID=52584 RepID=A0AAJ6GBV1_BRAPL|nr:DUF2157 domain-containing protein [Brachyspira pilosicoli]WIH89600.1 DUF2157 domain-containing protein [Brachyspira pilosicoli]WIH91895.1 DUF2157 domain-containing protein [Brachyspira pilosicoli]WIH94124.1 DUF2157 domain-containing protein [Brachyspira pilosicoli]
MSSKERFILKEIKKWYKDSLISEEQLKTLSSKYSNNIYLNWQPIIKSIMITGIVLVMIGFIAFISFYIFSLYFIAFLFTLLFVSGFIINEVMIRKEINLPKTSAVIIALSSIFLACDIFTIYYIIFGNKHNYTILFLITIIIFFIIAYIKKNYIVLSIALVSAITWYGFEGFDFPYIDSYIFNINNYIRVILMSTTIFLLGITDVNIKIFGNKYYLFSKIFYSVGILYLNIVLAIMSIFGTYDTVILFKDNKTETITYSIIFLITNIIMLTLGIKIKKMSIIKYSIFFILANMYIRYFEYFYLSMNSWIFFIILGVITILIGIVIERIIQNS